MGRPARWAGAPTRGWWTADGAGRGEGGRGAGAGALLLAAAAQPRSLPPLLPAGLQTKAANYPHGPRFKTYMHPVLGDGMFTADGVEWLHERKVAINMFNARRSGWWAWWAQRGGGGRGFWGAEGRGDGGGGWWWRLACSFTSCR